MYLEELHIPEMHPGQRATGIFCLVFVLERSVLFICLVFCVVFLICLYSFCVVCSILQVSLYFPFGVNQRLIKGEDYGCMI